MSRHAMPTILSDQSQRTTGTDAQSMNIAAARAVAATVRTTLGPTGRDKLLVDSNGDVVVTNDGITLLEAVDITHPAAELVIEVGRSQEANIGDGTTSAVILTGELLSIAEELIEKGVHPLTIVLGYRRALQLARGVLNDLAVSVNAGDTDVLEQVAMTAMTGKGTEHAKKPLAEAVVDAVSTVASDRGINREMIDVRPFHGGSIDDSVCYPGVLVGKKPPHESMPTTISDANIVIYEGGIETPETSIEATVSGIRDTDMFIDQEKSELDSLAKRISEVGANVVLTEGGIDDRAQARFVEEGVLALRRVRDSDRRRVSQATGATRLGSLDALTEADLGFAGQVDRRKIRELTHSGDSKPERVLEFENVPENAAATLILRAGTEHVLEEVERGVEDAIRTVSVSIENGALLPGGGATEMELALSIQDAASEITGREQLAVKAFANALEGIPRTLAENAGHDVIDVVAALTASHDDGNRMMGIDVDTGQPTDAFKKGIVEPWQVTESALASAVEAATMILRIDDVVAVDGLSMTDT